MPEPTDRPPPVPARRSAPDPFGKRALFWAQPEVPDRRDGTAQPAPLGKHALFSSASPPPDEAPARSAEDPLVGRGPVTVVCERCRAVSRIGFLDLLIFQLPIGYWFPRPVFDRRMTCPACRRRTWASVTLRR